MALPCPMAPPIAGWPPGKADRHNPFAPSPLQDFLATTGCSAPVPRLGTLTLVGPPLGLLPLHRDDRFPRSAREPGSSSRHLYAGRHPGSKQVPLGFVLESSKPPVLTSPLVFRHLISGSLVIVSMNLTCHDLLPRLFLNAHHPGSLPAQLKVVLSLLLQTGWDPHPPISRAVAHAFPITPGALVAHYLATVRSFQNLAILN